MNAELQPLTDEAIVALRADLLAGAYTLEALTSRLGESALNGLVRNSSVPVVRALAGRSDAQADLTRLWLLGLPVAQTRVRALHSGVDELLAAQLLVTDGDDYRAAVELKPYGDESFSGWICADPTPLDGRVGRPRPDFVLGASPASTTLAQLIPRDGVVSALDLGTGCGIQALHLAAHCRRIVATDLNPRALQLARITLGLAGVDADLRLGSLYEPVADDAFDLIVTNPPYVMTPPDSSGLIYREGVEIGDGLMRRVVSEAADRLNPGGTLIVLGNWAITERAWGERLAEWIPDGCDALVLQREVLDPFEYVELWLTDAGLSGSDDYQRRYAEWLDYFAGLGIESVGMGWLAVRKSGRAVPERRFEEWPHAVHQPVAAAFADFFDAIEPARLPEDELLAGFWRLHDGVLQETLGRPGAADPQHLVFRQQYGFGRAVEPGTALAAVAGACDGDLALGTLLDAVAAILEVDPDALRDELLPQVRRLIAEGYLLPA
ncbi:MAG: transferase [Actinobacteria bacterium HGW-Actinobacteria-2]|nr:MAG: transferase [Actinobacteria bacterium HGW-Actinobacteria-2]